MHYNIRRGGSTLQLMSHLHIGPGHEISHKALIPLRCRVPKLWFPQFVRDMASSTTLLNRPVPARMQRVSLPKKEAQLERDSDVARECLGHARIRNATLQGRVTTRDLAVRSTAVAVNMEEPARYKCSKSTQSLINQVLASRDAAF